MDLHKKLRAYRQSKGITQTFVANACGMSVKTLNAIELGRKRMLAEEFEHICREGLGVNPQIFFNDYVLETKKQNPTDEQSACREAS